MLGNSYFDVIFNSCAVCEDLIQYQPTKHSWEHVDDYLKTHVAVPRPELASVRLPKLEPSLGEELKALPWTRILIGVATAIYAVAIGVYLLWLGGVI